MTGWLSDRNLTLAVHALDGIKWYPDSAVWFNNEQSKQARLSSDGL
jgi:hypothetical protein